MVGYTSEKIMHHDCDLFVRYKYKLVYKYQNKILNEYSSVIMQPSYA